MGDLLMRRLIAVIMLLSTAVLAVSVQAENLRIVGEDKVFVATLASEEELPITRQMTRGKNLLLPRRYAGLGCPRPDHSRG